MFISRRDSLRQFNGEIIRRQNLPSVERVHHAVQTEAFENVFAGQSGDGLLRPAQSRRHVLHLRRDTDAHILKAAVTVVIHVEKAVFGLFFGEPLPHGLSVRGLAIR